MNRRHLEALRVVWLFGRPYWWDRGPGGRLVLRPALWLDHPSGGAIEAAGQLALDGGAP